MRTHNIYSPWPEEMNRQITGRIATYDFAPTPLSKQNLESEKAHGQIFVTGNTVIDALHMVVKRLKENKALAEEQEKVLADAGYDVSRLGVSTGTSTGTSAGSATVSATASPTATRRAYYHPYGP